jgi:hypothetical protein
VSVDRLRQSRARLQEATAVIERLRGALAAFDASLRGLDGEEADG